MRRHHRRARAARPHPGRRRLHLPRQLRLHHRPGVLVRVEPRRDRRLAAQARLARRDGRRLGAVRGVAAAAGGRHRHRRRHRLGPVVDRRPGAHLPDGDGPVLPRAPRRRPAHVRRAAGARRDRRGHRRRAVDGRGRGARPAARATSTRCSPRTTCASRCAATTSRPSPTAPPRWCWPPATAPASSSTGPAYITGFDHRTECHNPSFRALDDSPSTRIAAARRRPGRRAGRGGRAAGRVHPRGAAAAVACSASATTSP